MKKIKETIYKLYRFILQLLLPLRCPVCDGIVPMAAGKICAGCIGKLKVITPPWCMKCGRKLATEGEYCKDCRSKERAFVRGRALYEYESAALSIYRFKYGKRQEYAEFYGEEMARYLGDFVRKVNPEVIIPIPLHKKRLAKRGYNQAQVLAKELSRHLGIGIRSDILVRKQNTSPLKYENPAERQNNLKKAFIIVKNDVKLKRVLLIDDIYTTGSTVDSAARVLRASGVEEVYYVALACPTGM